MAHPRKSPLARIMADLTAEKLAVFVAILGGMLVALSCGPVDYIVNGYGFSSSAATDFTGWALTAMGVVAPFVSIKPPKTPCKFCNRKFEKLTDLSDFCSASCLRLFGSLPRDMQQPKRIRATPVFMCDKGID